MTNPALPDFAATADDLRRDELSRLAAAVTPRLEALRSMTAAALRDDIALMWDRLGHTVITSPADAGLVTIKGARKFVTACANPANLVPTGIPALRRLHDRVIALNAERGFYVTTRSFTVEAQQFAQTAPVQLIDGPELIRALHRSRRGMPILSSYKAMCRQCGDIVQHRLGDDEARRCANGHFVPPSIARAAIVKPRPPAPGEFKEPAPGQRLLTRREIRAHNYRYEARMMKKPRVR
jgi:Restriction endonuclease